MKHTHSYYSILYIIGELDYYCFRWAGLQEEIVRMRWYVDTLKNNERILDSKIKKMKQKEEMKDRQNVERNRDKTK